MKKFNMKRLISLLLAVLLVFTVGSISVLAGNGPGTGGGEQNAPLNLVSVRYETGSGYADLQGAELTDDTISGYIRFDRGMTTYSAANFMEITLANANDSFDLNLQQATSDITDGTNTYDKKYIYTFEVEELGTGNYTLTLDSGITANNGQTLTGAPLYRTFSVSIS